MKPTLITLASIMFLVTGCHQHEAHEIRPGLMKKVEEWDKLHDNGAVSRRVVLPLFSGGSLVVDIIEEGHSHFGFAKIDKWYSQLWILASGEYEVLDYSPNKVFVVINPRYCDTLQTVAENDTPKH